MMGRMLVPPTAAPRNAEQASGNSLKKRYKKEMEFEYVFNNIFFTVAMSRLSQCFHLSRSLG
jgi:hypothetical protein